MGKVYSGGEFVQYLHSPIVKVAVLVRKGHRDIVVLELSERVAKEVTEETGLKIEDNSLSFDMKVPHDQGTRIAIALGMKIDEIIDTRKGGEKDESA